MAHNICAPCTTSCCPLLVLPLPGMRLYAAMVSDGGKTTPTAASARFPPSVSGCPWSHGVTPRMAPLFVSPPPFLAVHGRMV
eukprot:249854-Chlamydomonas_euryale.AAC.1